MHNSFSRQFFSAIALFCGLLILLTACTNTTGNSPSPTATPKGTGKGNTPASSITPSPGISLGPQDCPLAVKSPEHWDPVVPTQPGTSKVESVFCGYLKGIAQLQAVVLVLNEGSGALLDVYVYDNITAATPKQLFKLMGLTHGNALISNYNTLLTAEVDPDSSVNKDQPNANLRQDLFREFKWSDSAGTLVQVAFPGLYPDPTRYQAEQDQQEVNKGTGGWKLDPKQVAQTFGVTFLHWSASANATLVSGGGAHDKDAVVTLAGSAPKSGIKLTMTRLEGNTNGGIWIVIGAQSDGASITSPTPQNSISSPVTVTGTGSAFEGVVGTVNVLDHLNNTIGSSQAKGATGNGSTTFSSSVTYTRSFKNGSEEGIVLLTEPSNADGSIAGAVFVKVLLA